LLKLWVICYAETVEHNRTFEDYATACLDAILMDRIDKNPAGPSKDVKDTDWYRDTFLLAATTYHAKTEIWGQIWTETMDPGK
jgi:hypothetical protein